MLDHCLFPIGVSVATGAAWIWVSATDRRRAALNRRLAEVTAGRDKEAPEPTVSLRRAVLGAGSHNLSRLPRALLARLNEELAATGHRIGIPHLIVVAALGAAVAALLIGGVMGFSPPIVVPVAALVALGACVTLVREAQRRYRQRFLEVFADALDLLARSVKAGLPVVDAMELASREIPEPVSTELKLTLDELHIGADMQEAFQRTANRIRVADFQFFVVSLGLQRRTGGGIAEMLSNLSALIRRRREVAVRARALTAEARASAGILALLPVIVGAALFYINADLMRLLLFDPRGRFMFGTAILILVSGIAMMFGMVRRAMR